jgi:hypothetical protein
MRFRLRVAESFERSEACERMLASAYLVQTMHKHKGKEKLAHNHRSLVGYVGIRGVTCRIIWVVVSPLGFNKCL